MSPKRSNHIIELYGLPGVGKSTLAQTLEKTYGYTRIAIPYRHMSRLRLFSLYPRTFLLWIQLIGKNFWHTKNVALLKYNISLLFSSLEKVYEAQQAASEHPVVLDEGLLQRFLSYADIVIDEHTIAAMVRRMPIGTQLVLVDDREPTTSRFIGSQNIRAQQGAIYLQTWQDNQQKQLTNLKQALVHYQPAHHWTTRELSIDAILKAINAQS